MKKKIFVEGMESARNFTNQDNIEMMEKLRAHNGKQHCCMFAMEELAELSKEISKLARGEGDYDNILQELADVYVTINNALGFDFKERNGKECSMIFLAHKELDKAVNVKLTAKMEQLGL